MAGKSAMRQVRHLERFYDLISRLSKSLDGGRSLANLSSARRLPLRGVYFFFEPGEVRTDSGTGPRIVRVGTHALKSGVRSTLAGRLRSHGGTKSGGGNHRGSIFRLLVGQALMQRGGPEICHTWGIGSDTAAAARKCGIPKSAILNTEQTLEAAVSDHLGTMKVIWLDVPDEAGPSSARGRIERNSIALLSNFNREAIDAATSIWLGHHSDRIRVAGSGLWNNNHVEELYDPDFLGEFERLVSAAEVIA